MKANWTRRPGGAHRSQSTSSRRERLELSRDRTTLSREYVLNIAGSQRYFSERPPIADYEELDRPMRSGEVSLALEIPPDFGRDVEHDRQVRIGVWIDGADPQRAETIRGYVQGTHAVWLDDVSRHRLGQRRGSPATIELRYRYNPDVIGRIYPTTHFITISQGTFSKALGFADLYGSFLPLLIAIPVLLGLSAVLLRKQET